MSIHDYLGQPALAAVKEVVRHRYNPTWAPPQAPTTEQHLCVVAECLVRYIDHLENRIDWLGQLALGILEVRTHEHDGNEGRAGEHQP